MIWSAADLAALGHELHRESGTGLPWLHRATHDKVRCQGLFHKSHFGVVKPFEKRTQACLAYLLFSDAYSGQRRVHERRLLTIIETNQTNIVWDPDPAAAKRPPQPEGHFIVYGYDRGRQRFARQNQIARPVPVIHEAGRPGTGDRIWFKFGLVTGLQEAGMAVPDPRVGEIAHENDIAVPLADEIADSLIFAAEPVKPHLIEVFIALEIENVVAENHKRHLQFLNTGQEVWVICSG